MFNDSSNSFISRLLTAAQIIFWAALWLIGLSIILLYPIRCLTGDTFNLVRVISYITPWMLVFYILMLIIAGLSRRKWLSLAFAVPIFVTIFTYAPLFVPNIQAHSLPKGFPLKVMSYNLHNIPEAEGIANVIRKEEPDILLVQELNIDKVLPYLRSNLTDIYPELYIDIVDQAGFKQAIFSRYPVKQISAEFDKGRVQKIIVETPFGVIEVWNVHPIPPFLTPPEQYDVQIAGLVADIATMKDPLIVGGDFNATDQSLAYQAINQYLRNAHWEVGWGFGFSFPAPPYTISANIPIQTGPLWRIDHIFYSRQFFVNSARTLSTAGGSDHFPIVAELLFLK